MTATTGSDGSIAAGKLNRDGSLPQILSLISHERGTGIVVAITSINKGAGVTYVSEQLAQELASDTTDKVICIPSSVLNEYAERTMGESRNYDIAWSDGFSGRRKLLQLLRERYQYIIVACSAIQSSSDVLSIAPLVDGVILVIEANRTASSEIATVESSIQAVRGKILGHVLNKCTNIIPNWLDSRL